ncbi:nucleotidyl transferase AbiEii/AbiGii toxin family protein [Rodentibacter pneumotropicus]|uniref:Nucleotidyl transferase AbiEii/AbiGii toxin family protein n=1 Tax=Rodentibacter pneumotropicus TaxID=758 RepID=A0A4S2PNV2_9PAST|nr:nucleotidyl transferase AbiEii/AbiGii toxin family protein [Rodentibacter pneumotropicus]THA00098.1 nucleotidyl transferase AbiEii/AbiGii toxin family protein [Rodentibacter pneumotropicus]THA00815.1 nucleotidyl transferase AbiEii/AbiGii toxin family protein [Rodentibacter pneumotropicus]THA04847.1 nucleotidyl transferase AbiEii/AbiGii toxin family protein [Rodentibacter pneumotropicus]THA13479.1 nucleotidyl transferase AbiEii/AbiGii toxin family protein [Rodentibacter pneumotropicus]
MEEKESNNVILTERDKQHECLMRAVLSNLVETPLVLKGGTALYLGYGLNRFSEDLDFDSDKKLNLVNKIKSSAPHGIVIDEVNVKKDTDTVSRYMVNYHVRDTGHKDSLKIEISYRNPPPTEQISVQNGIRVASIERITDNKLNASFDGENTRTKGRDLFDLHFIAKNYGDMLSLPILERLRTFSQDPDKLVSAYSEDIKADPLLNKIMDVDTISLELNEIAEKLHTARSSIKMEEETPAQALKRVLHSRRTSIPSEDEQDLDLNFDPNFELDSESRIAVENAIYQQMNAEEILNRYAEKSTNMNKSEIQSSTVNSIISKGLKRR